MKQADLLEMYKGFRHYFAKNMPKEIPIIITRSKSYAACAVWDLDTNEMAIRFGKGAMAEIMKDGATWENILLHEMCHIWEYLFSPKTIKYNGDWGGHSDRFYDKLRAVERLTGIKQYWSFDPNYRGK